MATMTTFYNKRLSVYMQEDVTVGDIIELTQNNLRGIVRFIGEIHCLRYTCDPIFGYNYFGIELDEPSGDNNGTINGEYYFETNENRGIFVKRNKIKRIITLNYYIPRLTINDVIYMHKFKCNARVRWIGKLDIDIDPYLIHFGIELNESYGTNNGYLNKQIYFSKCRNNYGVFINNKDLTDLMILKKSSLLLYGFLKNEIDIDYIPNDILYVMKSFFNFIHIGYHKTIKLTGKNSSNNDKIIYYGKYDVFNMDNYIIGPMIYKPKDTNHIYDKNSGIKIDTSADDYLQIFDEMAKKYGATTNELKEELKRVSISQLNGLRFVQR
eukprot:508340_1